MISHNSSRSQVLWCTGVKQELTIVYSRWQLRIVSNTKFTKCIEFARDRRQSALRPLSQAIWVKSFLIVAYLSPYNTLATEERQRQTFVRRLAYHS